MSHIDQIIETAVRLFVVLIPVATVILLLVAAHAIGGAAKPGRMESNRARPKPGPAGLPPVKQDAATVDHIDVTKSSAA